MMRLYRYPLQGERYGRRRYNMQHDIYSLGVCLLEIGLWEAFIKSSPTNMDRTLPPILAKSLYQTGEYILSRLLELTRSALPGHMGSKYAAVVETCLTCLDPDNVDFEDTYDEDGNPSWRTLHPGRE